MKNSHRQALRASSGQAGNAAVTTVIVLAVVVVGFLVWRYSTKDQAQTAASPSPTASVSESPTASPETSVSSSPSPLVSASVSVGSVKSFTVTGGEYFFNPSQITVKKGDTVKITFVNQGGTHDWVIDAFNARTPRIQGGQSATVTFVADKTGTFEYYCSVGSHRALGMKGNLIVR